MLQVIGEPPRSVRNGTTLKVANPNPPDTEVSVSPPLQFDPRPRCSGGVDDSLHSASILATRGLLYRGIRHLEIYEILNPRGAQNGWS